MVSLIQTIKQQTSSDCGLACLSMVSGIPIALIHEAYAKSGKKGRHKASQPWSSNTKDLVELAGSLGVVLRKFRFSTWMELPSISIVKVNHDPKARRFHWVACDWSDMYGPKSLLIHDPAFGQFCPFTHSERMGEDISGIYRPFGMGLAVTKCGEPTRPETNKVG